MSDWGEFVGEVVTRWVDGQSGPDRDMVLVEDFAYVDQHGERWEAPAGSVINGASIPGAFYQIAGPPYVGDYRRASVVHDVACVARTRDSEAVHLMFYNAMRCGGVNAFKAHSMYIAVWRGGPRWDVGDDGRAFSPYAGPAPEVIPVDAVRLEDATQRAVLELGPDASPIAVRERVGELLP